MNHQRVFTSSSKILKASGRDVFSANELQRAASNPGLKRSCSTSSTLTDLRKTTSTASWGKVASTPFAKFPSSSSFNQQCSSSSLAGLVASQESPAMGNATWDDVGSTTPNGRTNMFSLEMNGGGTIAPKRPNPFLNTMSDLFQSATTEEAKEDCTDDEDDEDTDEDNFNYSEVFTVPTFREKPVKSLNTRDLTSDDLVSLKEEDAFMYYSIPAVRRAVFEGREVDLNTASPVVERRSAISFESADVMDLDILQEIYGDFSEDSNGYADYDDILFSSMQDSQ